MQNSSQSYRTARNIAIDVEDVSLTFDRQAGMVFPDAPTSAAKDNFLSSLKPRPILRREHLKRYLDEHRPVTLKTLK